MSHKVIQETDARVGKWVKHAGSSAFHFLSHPSLPVFQLVNTSNFLGKPHRGREERPGVNRQGGIRTKVSLWHKAGKLQVGKGANTHTHILSHGAPVREEHSWGKWACAEHLAMTRAFFFFFFIGEGNGETQGLCQEGMNRQPWKSWDKDYWPALGTAA